MIADEATALLAKVLEQLSEVECALGRLRRSSWPAGAAGGEERSDAAVAFARSTAQTVAAKAVEVARVALLLFVRFEGEDAGSRSRPKKRLT